MLLQRHELVDEVDETERAWLTALQAAESVIGSASSPREAQTALQCEVGKSMKRHGDIVTGLLCAVLVYPTRAQEMLRLLNMVVRDGHAFGVSQLTLLLNDKLPRLQHSPAEQAVWLVRELVALDVTDAQQLCFPVLRHITRGDVSSRNASILAKALELFDAHRAWLANHTSLLQAVVYTLLDMLPDLVRVPGMSALQKRATALVLHLLQAHPQQCQGIGRDLVRVLQDVSKLPGFDVFWSEHLLAPRSAGISLTQLFDTTTPKALLRLRVPAEMERQLLWIMTDVKMGNQARYQTWFANRFLATKESEVIIPNLVRYICGHYHPPNHVISSAVVPRWAVIGWLLRCIKTNSIAANVKLALFYDWLFFDPHTSSIMNLEPAMLLMLHSLPKYKAFTATLLEFIMLIPDHYHVPMKHALRANVATAFRHLVRVRVVTSLDVFARSNDLGSDLRTLFTQRTQSTPRGSTASATSSAASSPGPRSASSSTVASPSPLASATSSGGNGSSSAASTSASKSETGRSSPRSAHSTTGITSGAVSGGSGSIGASASAPIAIDFDGAGSDGDDAEIADDGVDAAAALAWDGDPSTVVPDLLADLHTDAFDVLSARALPDSVTEVAAIAKYVMLHVLGPRRDLTLSFITRCLALVRDAGLVLRRDGKDALSVTGAASILPALVLGHAALYAQDGISLVACAATSPDAVLPPSDLPHLAMIVAFGAARTLTPPGTVQLPSALVQTALLRELDLLASDGPPRRFFLFFRSLLRHAILRPMILGSATVLHRMCSLLDAEHMLGICSDVQAGTLSLFGGPGVPRMPRLLHVIRASLRWDTWSQLALWQVIASEPADLDQHFPVLFPRVVEMLVPEKHHEALLGLMVLARRASMPSLAMMRIMVAQPRELHATFAAPIIRNWLTRLPPPRVLPLLKALLDKPGAPATAPIIADVMLAADVVHLLAMEPVRSAVFTTFAQCLAASPAAGSAEHSLLAAVRTAAAAADSSERGAKRARGSLDGTEANKRVRR